jgi:hypothetical protein
MAIHALTIILSVPFLIRLASSRWIPKAHGIHGIQLVFAFGTHNRFGTGIALPHDPMTELRIGTVSLRNIAMAVDFFE